jgi:hypothetical protein
MMNDPQPYDPDSRTLSGDADQGLIDRQEAGQVRRGHPVGYTGCHESACDIHRIRQEAGRQAGIVSIRPAGPPTMRPPTRGRVKHHVTTRTTTPTRGNRDGMPPTRNPADCPPSPSRFRHTYRPFTPSSCRHFLDSLFSFVWIQQPCLLCWKTHTNKNGEPGIALIPHPSRRFVPPSVRFLCAYTNTRPRPVTFRKYSFA